MTRLHLAAAAAALLHLFLLLGDTRADETESTALNSLVARADGSAIYIWNRDAVLSAENFLATSIPGTFTGVDVAPIIGTSTFYANGYTGAGTVSLNVEAGHIWNGHQTLGHVTSFSNDVGVPGPPYATPAYDRHATWVGMMIGGRWGGATRVVREGVAKDTDLRSGAIATSWNGSAYAGFFNATVGSVAAPYAVGFGTADTINSSWGGVGGSGSSEAAGTNAHAMITDSLANTNRFTTFVAAAGNSGASGANTVASPGSGYNGITVGALQNNGANIYDSVAALSSRGPQDYRSGTGPSILLARAAVDIAAPGTNLTSAYYGGQSGGNDPSLAGSVATGGPSYYSGGLTGTSFSAPIVAGAVSLMHGAAADLGLPVDAEDTRVVKANLLNAAAKIPGWDNGQIPHPNGNGGVSTTQALDYYSGAGALDMARTYSQYLLGQTDLPGVTGGLTSEPTGWDYASVALGGHTDVAITTPLLAGSEFRATLCWFRDRYYASATWQLDNAFADLNLQIWDSTFTTLFSESSSLYTPVEHLTFTLPASTSYGLRVVYPANVFGSIGSEEFGLAWAGVAVPEPSTIVLAVLGLAAIAFSRRRQRTKVITATVVIVTATFCDKACASTVQVTGTDNTQMTGIKSDYWLTSQDESLENAGGRDWANVGEGLSSKCRILLRFELPAISISNSNDILNATVTLRRSGYLGNDGVVDFYRLLEGWIEGTSLGEVGAAGANWVNRDHSGAVSWSAPGAVGAGSSLLAPTASKTVAGEYAIDIDVTADIRFWYDNGMNGQNFGWVIVENDEAYAFGMRLYTDDHGQSNIRPLLSITTIPGPGDANNDGKVNGADYTIWADHFLSTGQTWATGDFTGDGLVDGADYTVWADHYAPGPALAPVVPEPSSLVLAVGAGAGLILAQLVRRRRVVVSL